MHQIVAALYLALLVCVGWCSGRSLGAAPRSGRDGAGTGDLDVVADARCGVLSALIVAPVVLLGGIVVLRAAAHGD